MNGQEYQDYLATDEKWDTGECPPWYTTEMDEWAAEQLRLDARG